MTGTAIEAKGSRLKTRLSFDVRFGPEADIREATNRLLGQFFDSSIASMGME
jgi:hypothetical protein